MKKGHLVKVKRKKLNQLRNISRENLNKWCAINNTNINISGILNALEEIPVAKFKLTMNIEDLVKEKEPLFKRKDVQKIFKENQPHIYDQNEEFCYIFFQEMEEK